MCDFISRPAAASDESEGDTLRRNLLLLNKVSHLPNHGIERGGSLRSRPSCRLETGPSSPASQSDGVAPADPSRSFENINSMCCPRPATTDLRVGMETGTGARPRREREGANEFNFVDIFINQVSLAENIESRAIHINTELTRPPGGSFRNACGTHRRVGRLEQRSSMITFLASVCSPLKERSTLDNTC